MRKLSLVALLFTFACNPAEKAELPAPDYGEDGKFDSAKSPASTVELAYNTIATASFTSKSQYRAFRFDGKKGQKISIYVDGLKGLDTVAYLYRATTKPTGSTLVANDDTRQDGWTVQTNTRHNPFSSSIIDFVLPETRSYAVVATTYWGDTGKAEVVVKTQVGPQQCSGLIGYPECPADQYCALPDGLCNGADLPGYCQPRPQICNKIYKPVCGCNGVTYGNDCEREGAGAQKAFEGVCVKQLHNVAREYVFGFADNQYIYANEAEVTAANVSGVWLAFDGETDQALKFVRGTNDLWSERFDVDRVTANITVTAEH